MLIGICFHASAVEGKPKGKKSKSNKGNKHKQQDSLSAVSDASAVVTHTDLPDESGNGCTSGEGATTSTAPALEAEKVDKREAPAASASGTDHLILAVGCYGCEYAWGFCLLLQPRFNHAHPFESAVLDLFPVMPLIP